jgi:hypothetical protein
MTIDEVVAREPDLIIGSWCGKKFRPERLLISMRRTGLSGVLVLI